MASEAAVATFMDQLYDAAAFPKLWPDAVEGFRALLKGDVGNVVSHMTAVDLSTGSLSHNMVSGADPEMVLQGERYYLHEDLYAYAGYQKAQVAFRQGQDRLTLVSPEIIESEDLRSTDYYSDLLQKFRITGMMCAASLVGESKVFTLVANPIDSRPFEMSDKAFLEKLLGHIDRAFRLSVKVGFTDSGKAVGHLWEQSALPVMVVQQGSLTYSNGAAERLLRGSGVVARSGSGLLFTDENVNTALRQLIRSDRTSAPESNRSRQAAIQIHDSRGEGWMIQMVRLNSPRRDFVAQLFSVDPGVFIMLTPLNAVSAIRAGSIDSLARFTAVEKELLHALVDGRTIQQIARQTGRSEATLRWHVRNLLSKSGLRSLTDLIRFASLLMPF